MLQGFGFAPNTRFIQIAKNNREISDIAFRLQIISTVDQIQNMYWDLVFAYENVRVQNESLAFAQKTLSDTKKQVEIGTLAPIEVVRAQSTVATDQQALTAGPDQPATAAVADEECAQPHSCRSQAGRCRSNSDLHHAVAGNRNPWCPTQDLVTDALSHRAELAEARITLTNTEISNKAVRNALLPSLDLYAYYGGAGIGGNVALPPAPRVAAVVSIPALIPPTRRRPSAMVARSAIATH